MKKTIFLLSAILINVCFHAQTIEYAKNSISAVITPAGVLKGTTGVDAGYILSNGSIQNAAHITIGYILNDGTIQNGTHAVAGYVTNEGTVQDLQHNTLGFVMEDGTVKNSAGSPVAKAAGVNKIWVAVWYFFFKVN